MLTTSPDGIGAMAHATNGFTLIESMTVLAVAAIGFGIALPAFSDMLERTREVNTFHFVTASMMAARSTAITRHQPVSLCPSRDGLSCRDDLVWEDGWIMFLDPAHTGEPATPDAVLRQFDPIGKGLGLRSTAGRHRLRYQSSGLASGSNLSLTLCSGRGKTLLGKVIVNNGGRARTERSKGRFVPCSYAL